MRQLRLIVVCMLALSVIPHSYGTPIAHLVAQSAPGDYIGQGRSFDITYTPDNSFNFFPEIRRTIGPSQSPAELLFILGTVTSGLDNTYALLLFGSDQLGFPLRPGFFPNAERADFASPGHPGLDISLQNRGCNVVTGSFTIGDIAFSAAAAAATTSPIERFQASFEQHCEGALPVLVGTFSYRAFPAVVSEPSNFILVSSSLLLCAAFYSRRRSIAVRPWLTA